MLTVGGEHLTPGEKQNTLHRNWNLYYLSTREMTKMVMTFSKLIGVFDMFISICFYILLMKMTRINITSRLLVVH